MISSKLKLHFQVPAQFLPRKLPWSPRPRSGFKWELRLGRDGAGLKDAAWAQCSPPALVTLWVPLHTGSCARPHCSKQAFQPCFGRGRAGPHDLTVITSHGPASRRKKQTLKSPSASPQCSGRGWRCRLVLQAAGSVPCSGRPGWNSKVLVAGGKIPEIAQHSFDPRSWGLAGGAGATGSCGMGSLGLPQGSGLSRSSPWALLPGRVRGGGSLGTGKIPPLPPTQRP